MNASGGTWVSPLHYQDGEVLVEIRIKTQAEMRSERVTIEIVADDQEEAELVAGRLNPPTDPGVLGRLAGQEDRIIELEAELERRTGERDEREAARAKLEDQLARVEKGHVCVPSCRPNAHVAFQGRQRVKDLEAQLAEKDEEIAELGARLERGRLWAEDLAAALKQAENRLEAIDTLVSIDAVTRALNTHVVPEYASTMQDTIKGIREALDAQSPGDATSQA